MNFVGLINFLLINKRKGGEGPHSKNFGEKSFQASKGPPEDGVRPKQRITAYKKVGGRRRGRQVPSYRGLYSLGKIKGGGGA